MLMEQVKYKHTEPLIYKLIPKLAKLVDKRICDTFLFNFSHSLFGVCDNPGNATLP